MTTNNSQTIVYATNELYIPYLAVSIQSILENSNNNNNFNIYILHTSVSIETQKKVEHLQSTRLKINFINVLKYISCNKKQLKTKLHFTEEMYYRFLIPQLFKNQKKILYVDVDLVFNSNPQIFFDIDIEKFYLAATNDIGVLNKQSVFNSYVSSLNIKPTNYFNSGMLIMNIPKLNQMNFYQQFLNIINQEKDFWFPDQDIMNIICKNNVLLLNYQYNFQWAPYLNDIHKNNYPQKNYNDYITASNNPHIVHFTGSIKPWKYPQNILASNFWKYARRSPFYEEILYINSPVRNHIHFNFLKYIWYKFYSKITIINRNHYKKKYHEQKKLKKSTYL